MDKESIAERIVSELRHFLDESSKNTLGTLSRKTGISKTTLSRYIQNEGSTKLTAENAFCLLSYFSSQFEAASLMKEAYPKWYGITGKFILEQKRMSMAGRDSTHFKTPHYLIFEACLKNCSISEDEIIHRWGQEIGIVAANELIEFGYFAKDNSKYVIEDNFKDENYESMMKRIELECAHFPLENIGTTAFVWKLAEWMSYESREKSYEIMRKASVEIREIINKDSQKKDAFFKINLFGNWE